MNGQRWQEISVPYPLANDPRSWLAEQAGEYGLLYLLAYADDGVIWGRFNNSVQPSELTLSSAVFKDIQEVAVPFRTVTLQQARLFGSAGELLLWRSGEGLQARLMTDGATCPDDAFEEYYWLWGEGVASYTHSGFILMHEGQQGLRHAPPLPPPLIDGTGMRLRLRVRHYFDYDEQGQAYISLSRLVNLMSVSGESNAS